MSTVQLDTFEATSITGQRVKLADMAGQVVLIVNTASQCGFTPQFAGLEQLWQTYRDRGHDDPGLPQQ